MKERNRQIRRRKRRYRIVLLFFFSSRRRHTRYWRDWSSDVCSSDLLFDQRVEDRHQPLALGPDREVDRARLVDEVEHVVGAQALERPDERLLLAAVGIGRASCRGRVEDSVGAVSLKKKKCKKRMGVI